MRISDWSSDVCSSDLLSASVAVARQVPVASGGGASAADGGTGGTIARHAPRVTPSATAKTQMERPMILLLSPSPMVNLRGTKEIAQGRSGSARGPPAIDAEVGAGDIRRLVAGQEARQRRDLFNRPEPIGRLPREQHIVEHLFARHAACLHRIGDLVLDQRPPDIARTEAIQ